MSVARMRLARQCLEELKKDDPQTPITLNFIRSLCRRGLVPYVKAGKGYAINYDALLAYLANPPQEVPETVHGIRRVAE